MKSSEAQEPLRTHTVRRWSVPLVKTLVTAVLFGIIFYYVDFFETLQKINKLGTGAALAALLILCVQQWVGALRWLLILQSLGQTLSPLRSVQIFFASNVAGLLLVTTLGGLSVRGYLLYQAGASWPRAILSIGIERLFAIAALALCSAAGAVVFATEYGWDFLLGYDRTSLLVLSVVLAVAAIALAAVWRMQKERTSQMLAFAGKLITRPAATIASFVLSLLILLLGFSTVALISIFLDLEVSLLMLLSVQPIVAIMAALPVSLGGWGVRESAMIMGLGLVGVSSTDALTISVIYGALGLLSVLATAGATRIFSLSRERPPIDPTAHLGRPGPGLGDGATRRDDGLRRAFLSERGHARQLVA